MNDDVLEARFVAGGYWLGDTGLFRSSETGGANEPWNSSSFGGFRVASIPEPSTLILTAFVIAGMAARRRTSRSDDESATCAAIVTG